MFSIRRFVIGRFVVRSLSFVVCHPEERRILATRLLRSFVPQDDKPTERQTRRMTNYE